MIKSYDETYGQVVHTRTSYTGDEIIENANFVKSSLLNNKGETKLNIDSIGEFVKK